jgi:hypothetical protein
MKILAFAALAAFLLLAPRAAAADDDPSISNGATLDQHLARQREAGFDRADWVNPHFPQASASHGAPVAQPGNGLTVGPTDPGGSGDALLTSLVAGYDRAALDRGGWTNPLVSDSGYAAGSPLLGVRPGGGVTLFGPAADVAVDETQVATK